MNADQVNQINVAALQLIALLDDLEPAVATEVFSIVLAGRPNNEIRAIMDATRLRYQRITGRDIVDKLPRFDISIKRRN